MKLLRKTSRSDNQEKESVRKAQTEIKARLAALDAKISVKTRKPYVGGVIDAQLRKSHSL